MKRDDQRVLDRHTPDVIVALAELPASGVRIRRRRRAARGARRYFTAARSSAARARSVRSRSDVRVAPRDPLRGQGLLEQDKVSP